MFCWLKLTLDILVSIISPFSKPTFLGISSVGSGQRNSWHKAFDKNRENGCYQKLKPVLQPVVLMDSSTGGQITDDTASFMAVLRPWDSLGDM